MKERLENCIRLTNEVIYKWYTEGKVKKHQISKEDINAVFLQYLHKFVVKDDIDFKKYRKCIKFSLNSESLFIENLFTHSSYDHYKDLLTIKEVEKCLKLVEYKKCEPVDEEFLSVCEVVNISFNSIRNIKF